MVREAGVTHLLVDQVDFEKGHLSDWEGELAFDCGAYRIYKRGGVLKVKLYKDFLGLVEDRISFSVAPDVIGDAQATRRNWLKIPKTVRRRLRMLPVWHWNSPHDMLLAYLDESQLVGIGGLVKLMRISKRDGAEMEKDRDRMLAELAELCVQYPQRFHIFGINSLRAIETLKDLIWSGDTSKFLDSARYGHIIFTNSITARLTQCPAAVFRKSSRPELRAWAELDRHQRCVLSARNLQAFVTDKAAQIPIVKPSRLPLKGAK